jgi:uncharacterized damage-inducible protein DinB
MRPRVPGIGGPVTVVQLIRQFQFTQMTLARLLSDVSHEESLREVGPEGKCLNWLVGHIIFARGKLLSLLGHEPDWHEGIRAVYGEPGAAKFGVRTAHSLSDLQRLLDQSLKELSDTLSTEKSSLKRSCEELPHVSEGGTVADRVGSYCCHEAYHAGQIGMMRRLLGKPGLF